MNRPLILSFVLGSLCAVTAPALDSFKEGERLFQANKPLEAIAMLENAVKADPANEKASLWLGISYQQTGKYDEAVQVFRKALASSKVFRHLFYFNMGNSYFALKKMAFAEEMYSSALVENQDYSQAYLNRANCRMNLKKYENAASDYAFYLSMVPDTPQRESIEKVLALLRKSFEDESALKAREAAALIAEEERKKAMLEEVQKSLLDAAEATKNMSAGSEGVQGYEQENTLE